MCAWRTLSQAGAGASLLLASVSCVWVAPLPAGAQQLKEREKNERVRGEVRWPDFAAFPVCVVRMPEVRAHHIAAHAAADGHSSHPKRSHLSFSPR